MSQKVTDDLGRVLEYAYPPQRIVSLCPSITETLLELGLGEQVVGRTRYCIHPADSVEEIKHVGGTKRPRLDDINALRPDLIIAEKEENRREDVDKLEQDWPVYVCDVVDITSALKMTRDLGMLCGVAQHGDELAQKISRKFIQLSRLKTPLKTGYLIWRKPWMAAGADTYIDDVLRRCGFINVFAGFQGRYPELTVEDIQKAGIDLLMLSSEPYPFVDKHLEECSQLLPDADIRLVDGEAFSWYGAHMLQAADYLQTLIGQLNANRP